MLGHNSNHSNSNHNNRGSNSNSNNNSNHNNNNNHNNSNHSNRGSNIPITVLSPGATDNRSSPGDTKRNSQVSCCES